MDTVRLPAGILIHTEEFHPIIMQTIQFLGAKAEQKGFFSKLEMEQAFDENRVVVKKDKTKCQVTYLTRHGEPTSKEFRFPEGLEEDDEC